MTARPALLALAVAALLALGAPAAQAALSAPVPVSTRFLCAGVEPAKTAVCLDDRLFDLVETPTLPRP